MKLDRGRTQLVLLVTAVACTGKARVDDATKDAALEFARALCAREYDRAYAMTTSDYRRETSLPEMRESFEAVVPLDWGDTDPIAVANTMTDWPGKESMDRGWVFVSIYGDVYSEALALVVSEEGGVKKIRSVEWGRP